MTANLPAANVDHPSYFTRFASSGVLPVMGLGRKTCLARTERDDFAENAGLKGWMIAPFRNITPR
jgi:hypothetical protein